MARGKATGVDIGSRTIHVAEVRGGRGAPTVTNFGGIELANDAVRDGEVLDTASVAEALKELAGSAKIDKRVWLGISNQRVVVRQVDLPWVEPKELKSSLRYQVQEYIPIPVEEAELDVHLVDDFTTEEGDRLQRVLLVAAHRDMVAAHVEAGEKAGLKIVGVDLNPFAVLRAMGSTSTLDQGSEVLIDIGAGVTNIVVHEAGLPTFVRILVMGGDNITSALSSGLGVDRSEAEARKRDTGISDVDDVAARIIRERAEQFVDEVKSSLDYFQGQSPNTRMSSIVLTGGGALLEGLPERLATVVRLPVEVGSPFSRWEVKGTVYGPEDLARVGPTLATAIGLALGGLE